MFSSQINSRDLFFSNPVDHFLGNNAGLRTSGESGFNSSNCSQNRNAKDLLDPNNSYDIFTQSQKTNTGDEGNADYRKYISQNLLFGKAKKETRKKFKNFDNDDNENDRRSVIEDNSTANEITGIRDLLGSLAEGIRKIHSDLSVVQHSIRDVKTEISEQNERISSLDETLNNQAKSIAELEKEYKKSHKKDESIMKFRKLITENTDEIKQELNKLEDFIKEDLKTGKILESVKKLTTSQTNGNKKVLEDTKTHNEKILKKIDTKIDKHGNEFKSLLERVKSDNEINMEIKLNLKESMNALNASVKNLIDVSKTSHTQNEMIFKIPAAIINETQNRKSDQSLQKRPNICPQNSVHTPLARNFSQTENPLSSKKGNKRNTKQNESKFDSLLYTKPQMPTASRILRSRTKAQAAKPSEEKLRVCPQDTAHTPLAKSISEISFPLKKKRNDNNDCAQSERSLFVKSQVVNISNEYQKISSRQTQPSANDLRPDFCTQNSFHTPLAKSISQSEYSFPFRYINQNDSKVNAMHKQLYSRNCSFNIKRKASPNISPGFKRSPSITSKCITTFNRNQSYRNPNIMNRENYNDKGGNRGKFENDSLTQKSSPYLTLFEVTSMARGEFID